MATAIPQNSAVFTLSELAACSGGQIAPEHAQLVVRGVVTDSRQVQPGQLYVALRGERFDGHAFLEQAQLAGAHAAMVEHAQAEALAGAALPLLRVEDTRRALGEIALFHRQRWGKRLVAITGSAGKTTTKELTAAALRGVGKSVLCTVGNLNNDVGLPMTLLGLEPEHDVAVVEIGTSAPGEIAWLTHVAAPEVGVVTTVALAHVEKLGTLAAVAEEKCALLRGLPQSGAAIYSADSPELVSRVPTFGAERVLGFGLSDDSQVRLVREQLGPDLSTWLDYAVSGVAPESQLHTLALSICGKSAALDALAAIGVVLALEGEHALEAAGQGMRKLAPLPGRMRLLRGAHGALVIDDTYNANPASMAASLATLVELSKLRGGRAIAALADMAELGAHAQAEHEHVGRLVVELGLSDVVFCGTEMAHAARVALHEVQARRAKGPHVLHVMDPAAAVGPLARLLDSRAAILVKGSRSLGMERVVDALCPGWEDTQ